MPDDEYAKIFRNVFVRAGMSEEDIIAKGPATRLYKNRVYELPEFEIIKAGHEFNSNDGKMDCQNRLWSFARTHFFIR